MAAPLRPGKSSAFPDEPPCSECGGPVKIERRESKRLLGEKHVGVTLTRKCADPNCRLNGPNRLLGELP